LERSPSRTLLRRRPCSAPAVSTNRGAPSAADSFYTDRTVGWVQPDRDRDSDQVHHIGDPRRIERPVPQAATPARPVVRSPYCEHHRTMAYTALPTRRLTKSMRGDMLAAHHKTASEVVHARQAAVMVRLTKGRPGRVREVRRGLSRG